MKKPASLRVGVYTSETQVDEYIRTNQRKDDLHGLVGVLIHNVLLNYCNNISYTLLQSVVDAIILLDNDKIDLYWYYEPYTLLPENVTYTLTVGSRFLHYVHNYDIKSKSSSIKLILNQFDYDLWTMICILLSFILLSIQIRRYTYRTMNLFGEWNKSRRNPAILILQLSSSSIFDMVEILFASKIPNNFLKVPRWGILIVSLGFSQIIFIFVTLIKTDVITVDTSSIMNSLNQIVYSINELNFTACWVKSDIQVRSFKKANLNSPLHYFWHRYTEEDRCFFESNVADLLKLKSRKIIVFSDVNRAKLLLSLLCAQFMYSEFWMSENYLVEDLETLYVTKKFAPVFMQSQEQFNVFETGFVSHLKDQIYLILASETKKGKCYFTNLNILRSEYKSKDSRSVAEIMLKFVSKRAAASLLLNSSTKQTKNQLEKLFLIQSKNICHKNDLDPDQMALRLAPFPYKEKRFSFWHHWYKVEGFNATMGKFTENTKVVIVEGNVGSGKQALAKKLAEDMDMKYFPDVDADMEWKIKKDGWDFRDLNIHLHEDVKYPDFRSVLELKNPYHVGYWELALLRMRTYNYLAALVHLLHTGDGIVMEWSPWTGTVFARANKDMNLLSQNYLDHYWEVRSVAFSEMYSPHVVIYIDVPRDKCLENARLKNTHNCAEFLDDQYLESIEHNYKKYYLPIIEQHAEVFTYKLNQPVTDETAAELSELVVDELSQSEMDEYYMRITYKQDKFDDWRFFDSDERFQQLRANLTRNKIPILRAFEFYPYYVDELWQAHSLLMARNLITYDALERRDEMKAKNRTWKEKIFGGKKLTYDEKDQLDWFVRTGFAPDHLQACQ